MSVKNSKHTFGESTTGNEAMYAKRNGKIVALRFTQNMLDDAEIRAAKNPEDMPKLKKGFLQSIFG